MKNQFVKRFFFGNYFYGLCAIALSVEATLQQHFPLNPLPYYLAVFMLTVLYYTKAYLSESGGDPPNPRTEWYDKNRNGIWWSQLLFTLALLALGLIFCIQYWNALLHVSLFQWLLLITPTGVALLYYGINSNRFAHFNLRRIGWLKPFVIGFVWAALVTLYPVLYHSITHIQPVEITLIGLLLFLKNLMFVAVLCIMFDIKDYAIDNNQKLKTFVVKVGLRKTIFYVLIPLSVAGLGSFLTYGFTHQFSAIKILLNTIPFLMLIILAYSLHRRKSIFYYLVLIDGLMLLKALCGIVAMLYF